MDTVALPRKQENFLNVSYTLKSWLLTQASTLVKQ